jgi:hypothetical protein
MTNKVVLEQKNTITIHSPEMPPIKIPQPQPKTDTNMVKVIGQ